MDQPDRPLLLVVWHSRTGAAQAMAAAACAGFADQPAAVRLVAAEQAGPDDMLAATGYLFVCPENLGAMTGEMKAFFDRSYYALLGRIEGRAFATAIAAGTAGQGAQAQIDRIATGWRLRRVAPPLIVRLGVDSPEAIALPKVVHPDDLQRCHDLASALVTGLQLGIF